MTLRLQVLAALAALAALVSCYQPSVPECALACTAASGCPVGADCVAGFCATSGTAPVCSGSPDAGDAGDAGDDPDAPPATRLYRAVAAGGHHACAIDVEGRLWCWGANDGRQLGVTTTDGYAATPQHVVAVTGTWLEVTAGRAHTCGLVQPASGPVELWCWGENYSYQTGAPSGNTTPPHVVAVPTGNTWTHVTAGTSHTCAVLTSTGPGGAEVVMCWGSNDQGQLGTTGASRATPMPIDDLAVSPATTTWTSLSAGADHTCALAAAGAPYCWGGNQAGEGGASGGGLSFAARRVQGGLAFRAIAAGDDFTLGILGTPGAETLRCWGRNGARECGDLSTNDLDTPTAVANAGMQPTWKAIAPGLYGACGVQGAAGSSGPTGTVRCWGANDFGERGDGGFELVTYGPQAAAVTGAFAMASGHEFACALIGDGPATGGALRCWGDNADGQLGTGVTSDHRRPVRVGEAIRGNGAWYSVVASRVNTCAVLDGNTVATRQLYCWGASAAGQVDGAVALPHRTPVRVAGGDGAMEVVTGFHHTCVLRSTGASVEVQCWGSDDGQQLGQPGQGGPAPQVVPITGFFPTGLRGAGNATCVTSGSGAQCWGSPELSTPDFITSDTPTPPVLSGGAAPQEATLAMGPSSACWIDAGAVRCFGSNAFGQLGWGMSQGPTMHPVNVMGIADATALSSGPGNHRCALTSGGVAKCWGANGYNQVGIGDGIDKLAPVTVMAPNAFAQVVTGLNHTCGRTAAGAVLCWGGNDQYQRTQTTQQTSLPPSPIVAPVGEAQPVYTTIAAGEYHTCGISAAGVLYCWGASPYGQVGAGTGAEATPQLVVDGNP